MIITKMTLHNFGIYAGDNIFEFKNEKPIVLIGGMNGRGKTTFLEAVLLALYGSNSFAYTESKHSTYGQYLRSYVNEADGTYSTHIDLEFKLDQDTDELYLIHREWVGNKTRVYEKIDVKKNGEENAFLTENWPLFIENILPSGLANFFFFDGEKIAEIAVDSTSTQMKESIKALLGVTVVDMLENDISRIASRAAKKSKSKVELRELEALKEKKRLAEDALHSIDEEIAAIEEQQSIARKTLEKTQTRYSAKGGNIVEQKQELFNKRISLKSKEELMEEQLLMICGGKMPLALVRPLLESIAVQSQKEQDAKIDQMALDKVNEAYLQYCEEFGAGNEGLDGFIEFLKKKSEDSYTEVIYGLQEGTILQIKDLLDSRLVSDQNETADLLKRREGVKDKIDEIDSYLSVDIDENAISRLYKKMKQQEQELMDLDVQMENLKKKRASANGDCIRATSEYSKFVENMLKNLESDDDSDRILKYSHHVTTILNEYKVRLQANKIDALAKTVTECYKRLANKKNLISRIEIDPVTLDLKYIGAENEVVPKGSLSAGEKQLMVISLLWALAICSKKKLPVIIDTPLSRLDSNHRLALIKNYFPNASDQTIILSTDSEVDERYYSVMKKNVGDEFTLVYDDTTKSSSIVSGYFN